MAVGNQQPANTASDYATLQFIVREILSRAQTLTLCRVVSCSNEGGIVPVGTLTVQPLVNMMTGDRVAIQHKPLYNVPYCRVQGGRNAVIIDPEPGDIGLVAFCSRDISAVKASKDISNPGSFRQFDYADGVWISTCIGTDAPEQYVVMNADGVRVVSPTAIDIQAPVVRIIGALEQSGGDASFAQNVAITGNATAQEFTTAGNIGLGTHKHPTAPTGPVSGPIP
jgi:hypothetical protein